MAISRASETAVHRIILNVRTYERGLLFGYTAKQFDEYGWIRGMLPIVERIELDIRQYNLYRTVDGQHVCHRYAFDWSTGGLGGGSHPSVWDEPISDYKTAVKQGISGWSSVTPTLWSTAPTAPVQCLEDTQAHGETQRDQTAVFGAKQLLLFDIA